MDFHRLLAGLAEQRPIFHSEADFQHALAWLIHEVRPTATVRLEIPRDIDGRRAHVDVWVADGERLAIELKYLTTAVDAVVGDERFHLLNQAAQDLGRYDILKDLVRVERLVAAGSADRGIVIALSSDSTYWRDPQSHRSPNYAALRLTEGRTLSGTLAWGPGTGAGTMRGREAPIDLRGEYRCGWTEYSVVRSASSEIRFRYLLLEVRSLGIGPLAQP
jgi:hypothetical protein